MEFSIALALVLLPTLILSTTSVAANELTSYGLQVNDQGQLVKDGKQYKGIGVNYFDAFIRVLVDARDVSYKDGFRMLRDYEIPFVRFSAGGYWPIHWQLYRQDKESYFRLLDDVVRSAEENNIGLIPSFFWHHPTVGDLVGEPRSKFSDPQSASNEFIRTYTREVVSRYKDSPAIWGWEFGNEGNLDADLPNARDWRPPIVPHWGTPATRSELDDLTHDALRTAYTVFAEEVRKHDPERVIISGNSLPRPSAWHQLRYLSWSQDSEEQFAEMLRGDNPDPINTLSVHVYDWEEHRFSRSVSFQEILQMAMAISAKAQKPLFLGEFGVKEGTGEDGTRALFQDMLVVIEETEVPLAAMWVFDYKPQDEWNVTASNQRAYQLELIQAVNRRLSKEQSSY